MNKKLTCLRRACSRKWQYHFEVLNQTLYHSLLEFHGSLLCKLHKQPRHFMPFYNRILSHFTIATRECTIIPIQYMYISFRFFNYTNSWISTNLFGRLYQNIWLSVSRKPWRVSNPLPSASGDKTRQGFRVSSG